MCKTRFGSQGVILDGFQTFFLKNVNGMLCGQHIIIFFRIYHFVFSQTWTLASDGAKNQRNQERGVYILVHKAINLLTDIK